MWSSTKDLKKNKSLYIFFQVYAFLPNSLLLFEPECDRTLLQPVQPTLGKIQGVEEISKIETTACSMPYIATNKRFSVLLIKYIFCYYLNQSQYHINSSVGFAVEAAFLVLGMIASMYRLSI